MKGAWELPSPSFWLCQGFSKQLAIQIARWHFRVVIYITLKSCKNASTPLMGHYQQMLKAPPVYFRPLSNLFLKLLMPLSHTYLGLPRNVGPRISISISIPLITTLSSTKLTLTCHLSIIFLLSAVHKTALNQPCSSQKLRHQKYCLLISREPISKKF